MIMKMRNQSHSLFFVICFYFHNRSVLGSTENHPIFWVLVFYSLHSLSERVLKNPITLMRKCFFCLSIYPPRSRQPIEGKLENSFRSLGNDKINV